MREFSVKSPLLALSLFVIAAAARGQTLVVAPAHPLSAGTDHVVRTEIITLSVTGAEPFMPLTVFFGNVPGSVQHPAIEGTLLISPSAIIPLPSLDGLGIFGGHAFLLTDAAGSFTTSILIPGGFPLGPWSFQAITLQNPYGNAGGQILELSNRADIAVTEPPSSPLITSVSPSFVTEGAGGAITLRGTGFLPQSTVLPTVTFHPTCTVTAGVPGTNVRIVEDPGPGTDPVILVDAPADLGFPTNPPLTSAGPARITVSFATTPLYPVTPAASMATTNPTGEPDPTFIAWQSPAGPEITALSPAGADTAGGGCTITITGTHFLRCTAPSSPVATRVLFDAAGASPIEATGVTVVSATEITAVIPPHGAGLVAVQVVNPDSFLASPRQSTTGTPASEFRYFDFDPSGIQISSITPSTIVEGSSPATITIAGTAPAIAGVSLLDPALGPIELDVGSILLGLEREADATVKSIGFGPGGGTFQIVATVPPWPPGLNPVGPSFNGLTNTGPKSVQIKAAPCVNPSGLEHTSYALAKPGNRFVYVATQPPHVTSILPNNVGRVSGGQLVTLVGSGFLTTDTALPSTQSALGPAAVFAGTTSFPATFVRMVNATAIEVLTPDAGAAGPPPVLRDAMVTNPDEQSSATAAQGDDFYFYPPLAGLVDQTFPLTPPLVIVDTGTGGVPIVYNFTSDLVIPSGLTIEARGDYPLIIRCRGDIVVDGFFDLSGASVTGPPYFAPAGAGAGGPAFDDQVPGSQDPIEGNPGDAPIDPATLLLFPGGGFGGVHGVLFAGPAIGGGGGGGGMDMPGLMGLPISGSLGIGAGGTPGGAYGFLGVAPIPVLGSGTPAETGLPPGGAGGGAGGLGLPIPYNPVSPPPTPLIGVNGRGGNGGGGLILAADGVVALNGSLLVNGEDGHPGAIASADPDRKGGGGGGGSGGSVVLQALRGIVVGATAVVDAGGGLGGAGASVAPSNEGGAGSPGLIRLAMPADTFSLASTLFVLPGATLTPFFDFTTYLP